MISYPFTAKLVDEEYDRVIDSATERAFNKQKWTNGVWAYPTDGMKIVPSSGMTVSANIGGCQIEGAQGYNDTALPIILDASNSTLGRIDRIVARFDLNDSVRSIDIYKLVGTFSSNPVAEALTQEPNYYEIALADIKINAGATEITLADITDQRLNSDLCGVVIPAIPTPIDTSSLFTQYQDALNQFLAVVAAALDETLAGQLQTNIDTVQDNVEPIKKYNVAIAVSTTKFKIDLGKELATNEVIKISFPSATASTSWVQFSVDNGVSYKYIKMGSELSVSDVKGKDIELKLVGTYFEPMQAISGETENGTWQKFPDGIMKQWFTKTNGTTPMTTSYGSIFYATMPDWTFPMPFVDNDITFTGAARTDGLSNLLNPDVYIDHVSAKIWSPVSYSAPSSKVYLNAIGRWK